jgi:nitronate monooxygenase
LAGNPPMSCRELFGIELPIIQAPMAGVQGSELAIAVSRAGGLGSLPCALLGVDALRRELDAMTAGTNRPFNVNFFCHGAPVFDAGREAAWRALLSPYYKEMGVAHDGESSVPLRAPFSDDAAEVLEQYRPAVISFHFGLPSARLLSRVRAWGSKIMASATTVQEAIWLEQHGADAIIAQGLEAGGHRGMFLTDDLTTQIGTLALVPQITSNVRLPVIAAGGIADSRGVAAALALGAVAAQVGTAYLLCPEAATSPIHRAALRSPASNHTALTNLFSGRPARSIVNRLMREIGPIHSAAPPFPLSGAAIAPLRSRAESLGSSDFSALWCGQQPSGCKEIPAGELTKELAANHASAVDGAKRITVI